MTSSHAATRTLTAELPNHLDEIVLLKGWVHIVRKMKDFNFLVLRDRSGNAQVILSPEEIAKLDGLQVETVVAVTGKVVEEPRAALGVEIHEATLEVISPVTEILPFEINKKVLKPAIDVFLNHAAVGLRAPSKQSTFRLYADLLAGFRGYLEPRGFTEIHTPILVGSATEGGANVFSLDYFGKTAYLAQSPQLYKQIMVGVFERVFEIGPAIRAEVHATARHLNEYNSLDVEMGYIESYADIMDLLIELIEFMIQTAVDRHPRDVKALAIQLPRFGDVPRITFRRAQQIILDRNGEDRFAEPDLSPQDERWLGEWAAETHDSDFVFVTHYPSSKRPFYTMPDPAAPDTSLSFDLLFRGQELVTGGQRINDYDQLIGNMAARSVSPEPFIGYLEAFRFGMPPEGGFAIGSERLLMRLVGADNIRETTLFPRDVNRLTP